MIKAKLFVLKQEIELLWTDMRYHRTPKSIGQRKSEVLGGMISVRFETRDDTEELLRWMTKESLDDTFRESDKMEEGKVCFYNDGYDYPPTKTYLFNDAFLVDFSEVFDADENAQLQTSLTISPAIQNYGVEVIKPWNLSYVAPSEDSYEPSPAESTEKKIVETYYEDLDGKRIRELKIGTEVYLVIISENITGKAVNVNLSDKKNDFIHNGSLLEDDLLKDLIISGDTHKEKLKVIAQHELPPREETPTDQEEETVPQEEETSPQGEANSPQIGLPPILPTNEGPKEVVDYYLTDAGGTKIEEYEVGDKIILNIETKNRIGDKITLKIEDKTHDFKYNGEVLENDMLTDFTISKDKEKLELEVIVQLP